MESDKISVIGARSNNLKNISVDIPSKSLTVITGLSGSGKSSLAFDTIFAEGQRRYLETFSAYARNFMGNLQRPDVDKISGLSPVISIEQKTTNKNPRSTVGTTTEVYDYLRLLFARAGEAYSYLSGRKMIKFTEDQVLDLIVNEYNGQKIYILAPLVRNRKGHYAELFESIRRKGYLNVRIDGELREVKVGMKLDRYKNHTIEVVIEKLVVNERYHQRLVESVRLAMKQGDGLMSILSFPSDANMIPGLPVQGVVKYYSKQLMCPETGLSYKEPAPHNFSFNSPHGFCHKCKGLGYVSQVDADKVFPDRTISVRKGAIAPLGPYKNTLIFRQIAALLQKYDFTLDTPFNKISEEGQKAIFYGTNGERIKMVRENEYGSGTYMTEFEGIINNLERRYRETTSDWSRRDIEQYLLSQGIEFVTDSTNADIRYKRNLIRCQILPRLGEINTSISQTLHQTTSRLSEALHLYELGLAQVKSEICSYTADGVSIDITKLLASPAASTILHEVLSEFHFKSAEIEVVYKKISSFSAPSACQSGATFYSSSHVAALHRGHLVVAPTPGSLSLTLLPETGDIELPTGRLCIARFDRDSLTEIPRSPLVCCLDVDSIKGHLAIRSTTEGDRFNPFGMKGTKLVSDYLTDRHRSIIEKRRAMVVVDEEKILWLVGERPDGRATITDKTKQVVMLSFSPKE